MNSGQYSRNLFQRLGVSPPITLEIYSIGHVIMAVRIGLGISIMPSIPLVAAQNELVYLSLEDQSTQINIAAVTRRGKHCTRAEGHLIELMHEAYTTV